MSPNDQSELSDVNGIQAVSEAREHQPREVHGYVVLEQLNGNRLLSAIPVLVVTGRGPEVAEQETREYGAVAFLQKPLKADAVIATLRGVLGKPA